MRRTLIAVAVVWQAAGCGGCGCPEGVERGIEVFGSSWAVNGTAGGLIFPGIARQEFPIADGSPFLGCTELGNVTVAGNASIQEADFPAVVKMGDLIGFANETTPALLVEGFDNVVEMGAIRGEIREISGFGSIEVLDKLDGPTVVTGLGALREVVGDLHVEVLPAGFGVEKIGGALRLKYSEGQLDLPRLRDVGGDVDIVATWYQRWSLPALAHIGGSLNVSYNDELLTWPGFADEITIDGDVIAQSNIAISNEDIEAWLDSGEAEIGGEACLCRNAGDETNCNCFEG